MGETVSRLVTETWATAPVSTLEVMAFLGSVFEVDGDAIGMIRRGAPALGAELSKRGDL